MLLFPGLLYFQINFRICSSGHLPQTLGFLLKFSKLFSRIFWVFYQCNKGSFLFICVCSVLFFILFIYMNLRLFSTILFLFPFNLCFICIYITHTCKRKPKIVLQCTFCCSALHNYVTLMKIKISLIWYNTVELKFSHSPSLTTSCSQSLSSIYRHTHAAGPQCPVTYSGSSALSLELMLLKNTH